MRTRIQRINMLDYARYWEGLERVYGHRTCDLCGREVFNRDRCTECSKAIESLNQELDEECETLKAFDPAKMREMPEETSEALDEKLLQIMRPAV